MKIIKNLIKLSDDSQIQYQVFFMKKLWLNTVPGKDLNADHKFYFHQEVPKVINGYYKISKAEAVKLAALIYRGKCGEVATTPAMIQKQLHSLVPEDVIGQQKSDDWKKQILAAYNGSKGFFF